MAESGFEPSSGQIMYFLSPMPCGFTEVGAWIVGSNDSTRGPDLSNHSVGSLTFAVGNQRLREIKCLVQGHTAKPPESRIRK